MKLRSLLSSLSLRSVLLASSAVGVLALSSVAGCGNSTPASGAAGAGAGGETGTTTAAVASGSAKPAPSGSAADGKRGHRMNRAALARGRRGGSHSIAARFFDEADDLDDLTDEQKATVEKLEKDARPEGGAAKADWKELQTELAAGVKAGKIDTAKIDAKNATLEKAMADAHAKEAESLNGLHAALKPEQRKALVAALKAKADKQNERAAKHQEDKKADEKDKKTDEKKAKNDERNKRKLERLTKQLDLDAAQQKKVEAILAKDKEEPMTPAAMDAAREDQKKKLDAVLTAFDADTFDAKKLDLGGMPTAVMAKKGKGGAMAHEVGFLTQLLPILKPEQREKLAASMEKERPWGMGRMGDAGAGHHFGFFDDPPADGGAGMPRNMPMPMHMPMPVAPVPAGKN
jgi:Spy/CpxP family protein refolding chaperone